MARELERRAEADGIFESELLRLMICTYRRELALMAKGLSVGSEEDVERLAVEDRWDP